VREAETITRWRVIGLLYDDEGEARAAAAAGSDDEQQLEVTEEIYERLYDVIDVTANRQEIVGVPDPEVAAEELARLQRQASSPAWRGEPHEFEIRDRLARVVEDEEE
jgi:hypothetical protein